MSKNAFRITVRSLIRLQSDLVQHCYSYTTAKLDYYGISRAQEGVFDNFSYFPLKSYVVTPHLNRLVVQMRGHNIRFMQN